MRDKFISSNDDLLEVLDELLADRVGSWWNEFYADRVKPCPFFGDWPDENLVDWFTSGLLGPGRVLELGCGNGRNAVYLAGKGCVVDAVDFSAEAIGWARERVEATSATVALQCCSIFDATFPPNSMDLVYDHGCFHHLPPHRRPTYVELVLRALKPGGAYGLVAFGPEGGSGLSDREVYERRTLGGGLGYTEQDLRALWSGRLDIDEVRGMRPQPADAKQFGEDFLVVLRATKPANDA